MADGDGVRINCSLENTGKPHVVNMPSYVPVWGRGGEEGYI